MYLRSVKDSGDLKNLTEEIRKLLSNSLKFELEEIGTLLIEDSKENKSIDFLLDNIDKSYPTILCIITIITSLREDHARFLVKHH